MIKTLILLLLVTFSSLLLSQASAPLVTVCSLPSVINESSGIEKTGANSFWSHNDSGGQPQLYQFDSSGVLLKTLTISNATNIDWEDIAEDSLKNIYIGDFGNNNNDRSVANNNRLKIYKITNPNLIAGTTTTASIINFEYVDRNFSASSGNHNFDMEGFFFFNDSLHLFTKNRTSPSNGWIKHYVLPSTAGTYTAMVVDSFNNGGTRITAADISPNKKTVALSANDKIWLFSCYRGSKFISTGTHKVLTVPFSQKEAIVFSTDSIIYMTDELTGSVGRKLYRANISAALPQPITLTISSSSATICAGETASITITGASSYTWNTGATGSNIVVSPTVSTNYSVIATATNNCQNSSVFTQDVSICTDITSYSSNSEMKIFPNPFLDKFSVSINKENYTDIEIYNSLGSLIYVTNIKQNHLEIDLKNQKEGIYFVKLKNKNGFTVKKIIKQ